ncbi:hypothetical protein FEM41_07660 [Jejubacter calystegiae]|uniref:Carnitine dehydratase n=1 Tax=Jejubacter calystegiae TaxID=2579935 RepID=A0A4V1G7G2_9ENTR|nr:CoA transferase [Jejubacter calystegiae]QCT19537.1 hypothetical protein FEM41_07660 [Jejubacter calystegiae]
MATNNHLKKRTLASGELFPLSCLLETLHLGSDIWGSVTLEGEDPVIQSPHYLGEASASAHLSIGVAGAAIWKERTGKTTDITINILDALNHLHPTHFVQQQGKMINVGAEFVPVNGLFRCRDERHIMLEAGPPYTKLQKGYQNFFDCGDNKVSYTREVAQWESFALEEALSCAGLPACRTFTPEEWRSHPQGKLLAETPVVEIVKISDGDPVPFMHTGELTAPLAGVKVLDFTHVLAGPRSARTLAEYGADVLHISTHQHPDTFSQHLGVDVGKRCAYLDMNSPVDREKMGWLLEDADVFTTTYRTSVNDRFGLTPEQAANKSRRGIIYMSANAYGHRGPWAFRPGFDQNAQVASGFAYTEGGGNNPCFSPVFYLADLITGYLAAAGMMAALLRRAREGGSYHVRLSLARSVMWVQELGLLDTCMQSHLPAKDTYRPRLVSYDSVYGTITNLAPPLTFSTLKLPQTTWIEPYGASEASWSSFLR